GARLRRVLDAFIRSGAARAAFLARLLVRHRPRRRGMARQGYEPSTHAPRREGMAGDLLHDGHGPFAHERERHRVGAHAVARDAAGCVGGAAEGQYLTDANRRPEPLRRTYRPRPPSYLPNRRTRPRTASLSRSWRTRAPPLTPWAPAATRRVCRRQRE